MRGRLIGDRYRLLEPIASGGFGQVWRAHDERLDVDVAVKRVRVDPWLPGAERARLVARARQEARNAAALRDAPNVVAVHDVVTEDGLPWVVMRLVDGHSLAQELSRRTRLAPDRAARIALGVLAALRAAHAAGIVHRDVKPANIMLTADGQVVLIDFGIAKHRADASLTSTGTFIGSFEYMAPERFGSGRTANGPAGDLFSLGATLFEMVEGRSPFRRGTVAATMAAVSFEPTPPMNNAGPLTGLIGSLLAKKPGDRPGVDEAVAVLRATTHTPAAPRRAAGRPREPDRPRVPAAARVPAAQGPAPARVPAVSRALASAHMIKTVLAAVAYIWAGFLPIMSQYWIDRSSGAQAARVTLTFDLFHPWARQNPTGGPGLADDWGMVAVFGIGTAVALALCAALPWLLRSRDPDLKVAGKAAYAIGWAWGGLVAFCALFILMTTVARVPDEDPAFYLRGVLQPGAWLMLLANGLAVSALWRIRPVVGRFGPGPKRRIEVAR